MYSVGWLFEFDTNYNSPFVPPRGMTHRTMSRYSTTALHLAHSLQALQHTKSEEWDVAQR